MINIKNSKLHKKVFIHNAQYNTILLFIIFSMLESRQRVHHGRNRQ